MAVNPVTYVKNVGKSFGYIAMETLGATSPAMKELISDNKDTISDLYHQIKDFSSSPMDKIRSNQKIMSYSNDIKTGLSNLVSDIKTGNFYNQARSDDAMNSMLGLDFDFDSMFDEDFDFDSEISSSNSATAATVAEGTNKEILAMDVVGSRISTAVGSATAKSAEYIVNANAESTRAILNQNSKIFSALSTGMVGINQTLGSIAQLGQPLTQHMQNSSVFYTKSTENQLKMIELLEKIEKNTAKPVATSSSSKKYVTIDDYLTGSGVLDLGKMLSMAKGNAKNAIDSSMLGMLFSMNDMLGEGTMTKMFAANPLGMIMPMILEGAIMTPNLKKSLNNFSNALTAMSRKAIRDLGKMRNSADPIKAFIGELFGFDTGSNKREYKGDYKKGAVSFDGYTRQAIVKVIPEYLSMILKAVSGSEQRYYDYEKGRFVTEGSIRKKMKEDEIKAIQRLGSNIKISASSDIDSLEESELLEKAFDHYIANAIDKGESYYIFAGTVVGKDYKRYGFKTKKEYDAFERYRIRTKDPNYKGDRFTLDDLNAKIDNERIYRAKNSYKSTDVESYLLDNSQFTHTSGTGSRSRQSRTRGGSRSGSKSDDEAAAGAEFDKAKIHKKLIDAGFSTDSSDYKKLMKDFDNLEKKGDNLSNSDIEKYLDRVNKTINFKNSRTGKGFLSAQDAINKVQSFIEAPLDAVASILNRGSKAIYNLMYGKDGEEDNKSILGHIFMNMKDMFTKFKDWTKETIFDPIKKLIDDHGGIKGLFEDFFGIRGKVDEFKEKFKNKAREVTNNVGQRFRSAGRWAWQNSPIREARDNYRARKQQRTREEWNEDLTEQFLSGYDSGEGSGLVYRGGASGFGGEVVNEGKNAILSFIHAIFPDKKDLEKDLGKVGDVTKKSLNELKLDPSGAITGALIGTGVSILTGGIVGPFLAASLGGAAGLTINSETVQKALFGEDVVDKDGNKTGEKTGGLLSSKISTFLTRDLGKVASYGITGGVLSLMPFIPGGPVTGLILGSAIGFANREGALANAIFGEEYTDQEGVKHRKDNGFLSANFQNKVKKLLPKAAAGAIAGLVAGPFGLLPNIMLGAGLGFASETETFKRVIFGEEVEEDEIGPDGKKTGNKVKVRKGGLTGYIRNDIIKPVANAIQPIASELAYHGKKFIRGLGNRIYDMLHRVVMIPLSHRIFQHLISPLGKVLKKPAEWLGGVISAPFKAVGAVGKHLKNKQVSRGRAGYMSAQERLAYRESLDYKNRDSLSNKIHSALFGTEGESLVDSFVEFDTALAGMDEKQLSTMADRLKEAKSIQRKNFSAQQGRMKEIYTYIESLRGTRAAEVFNKGFKKGKNSLDAGLVTLNAYLNSPKNSLEPLSEENLAQIKALYERYVESTKLTFSANAEEAEALEELQKTLKLNGITKLDDMEVYLDTVKEELRHRKNGVAAVKLNADEVRNNLIEAQTNKLDARLVDILNTVRAVVHLKPIKGGTDDYTSGSHGVTELVDKAKGKLSDEAKEDIMDEYADKLVPSGTGSRLRKWMGRGALIGGASGIFGIMKTKIDGQGQESLDMADKETRESIRLRDSVFDGFKDIKDYVKGIFNKMDDLGDNEEEEEKKKGFLESLLTGENGLLGALGSWLGGTKIGKWASGFVSKLPTGKTLIAGGLSIAAGAIGLKVFIDAVTGKLDTIANKMGLGDRGKDQTANQGTNSGTSYTNWAGTNANGETEAVATDEKGNPIQDENGNYISTNGNILTGVHYVAGQGTFQQKMIGNTARSLVTGTGVALSSVRAIGKGVDKLTGGFVKGGLATRIGQATIGKAGSAIATKIGTGVLNKAVERNAARLTEKAVSNGIKVSAEAIAKKAAEQGVAGVLNEQIYKVFNALKKVKFLKGMSSQLDNMAASLGETCTKKLAGKGAEEVGKAVLGVAAFAARLALIAWDFEEGYNHAQRTLGIKEPTTGQKILSGIIRAVKNLIPIVGSLIPDKVVVDLFVKILAPLFGIQPNKFLAEQQEAQDELAAYNEEYGTDLTWDEYVQQVGRDEGWGERTWGEGIKEGAKNVWQSVKGGAVKAGAAIKNGWQAAKTKVGAVVESVKNSKVGQALGTAVTSVAGYMKSLTQARAQLWQIAKRGNVDEVLHYQVGQTIDEENPLAGLLKINIIIDKILSMPIALVSNIGHKVADKVKEIVTRNINNLKTIYTGEQQIKQLTFAGKPMELFQSTYPEDPENPVGGIFKALYNAEKIMYMPIAGVSWVGHKIGDGISAVVQKVKDKFTNIKTSINAYGEYIKTGDMESWMRSTGEAINEVDPDDPMAPLKKSIKLTASVITGAPILIKYFVGKVGDKISEVIGNVKDTAGKMKSTVSTMKTYAEEGRVDEVLKLNMAKTEGNNILDAIFGFATKFMKAIYTVIGIFNLIKKPIQQLAEDATGKWDDFKSGIKERWENSWIYKTWNLITNGDDKYDENGNIREGYTGGSSFVSQIDPSIAGKKFGSSTIGANGCAPSVASMITGVPITATASYASRRGYANKYGTSADYFSSVFNAAGIPAEYVYTGAGSAQDYLASRIASGSPTVLLGRDPYNTSKAYSPFGPGNHYVLATGMTRDGGVIIQDPESRTPNNVYDSSILNSVKLGIPTGGRSGLLRRLRGRGIVLPEEFADYDQTHQHLGYSTSGNVSDRGYSSSTEGYTSSIPGGVNYSTDSRYQAPSNTSTSSSSYVDPQAKYRDLEQARRTGAYAPKGNDGKVTNLDMTVENCVNENLGKWSRPTLSEMNDWIARVARDGSPFIGQGVVFLEAADASGLDPRYILAHAAIESGWGTSRFARERGNYFGIGAFDSNPNNAYTMGETLKAGIIEGAKWIAKNYYHGKYGQTTVYKMRYNGGVHQYCTSTTWVESIGKIMAKGPKNLYMTLEDGIMSDINGSVTSLSSTAGNAIDSATSGSTGGKKNDMSLLDFGAMFGRLVAAKFGKLGKLFGLSSGDEESEYNGENGYGAGEDTSDSSLSNYGGTGDWENVVNAKKGPVKQQQIDLVQKMKSMQGKLQYSMKGPRDPEQGSADCSSTVNWAFNKVLGKGVGGTTLAIMQSGNLSTIDKSNLPSSGGTGSGPNLDKLMPGDLVLLSRPDSSFTSGRPYRVGHVEMYIGDGQTIGHGSTGGTKIRNIESDKYIMARRFNGFIDGVDEEGYQYSASNGVSIPGSSGSSTNVLSQSERDLEQARRSGAYVGTGSGLVYNIAQDGLNTVHRRHRGARSAFGGSSGLVNLSRYSSTRKAQYYRDLRGGASLTGIDNNEALIVMVKAIISLLTNISANSDKIGGITDAINNLASATAGNNDTGMQVANAQNAMGVGDTDKTIQELSNLLHTLAAGA